MARATQKNAPGERQDSQEAFTVVSEKPDAPRRRQHPGREGAAARDECVKVRRRCETAERALAELRQRFGVDDDDGAAAGGGANGLGQIFDNLTEMETMVLADSKEADRRLRARAKRADAHEVVGRMDETQMGLS